MPVLNNIRQRKPFHEALVDMITHASSADLEAIGLLLTTTVIPEGHAEIITALRKRCVEMCWNPNSISYLQESILLHKAEMQTHGDTIKVSISLRGQTYEGNFDLEESFVATLMAVQRQGNNKIVEALGYLAELGDNHHMDPSHTISRKNRLGF